MGDEPQQRPKRRTAASRAAAQPSAAHYVGYVEDEETPESIARKFEELERIQSRLRDAAAASATERPAGDGNDSEMGPMSQDELSEEQLMEVFQQTSSFTVHSAVNRNEGFMEGSGGGAGPGYQSGDDLLGSEDEEETLPEAQDFWSDDDGAYEEEGRKPKKSLRKKGATGQSRVPARERGISMAADKPVYTEMTTFDPATQSYVRRKVQVVDPSALERIRVPPPPLPASWGRSVAPYRPAQARGQPSVYDAMFHAPLPPTPPQASGEVADDDGPRSTAAPTAIHAGAGTPAREAFSRQYQAVLVNPGWCWDAPTVAVLEMSQAESQAFSRRVLQAFATLPLKRLCPVGFAFVWVEKQYLHGVVKQMDSWGFVYIENLTWVQVKPNNKTVQAPSSFLRRSHQTLLMFRKEGLGKDIELRHQRRPDVFFDCIRTRPEGGWHVPKEVYLTLETLLPTGMGSFLEIWAAQGAFRNGWTMVVDPVV